VKRALFCWLSCAAGVLGAALACAATERRAPASPAAILKVGEAIYRRGVLPSGAPLVGQRAAGATVEGVDAACTRCHRRSGLGVMEGRGSSIPPISGLYLFKPRSHDDNDLPFVESMRAERDPYTEATLARAIREGIAADGRPLGYLMPRFALDDAAMASTLVVDSREAVLKESGDVILSKARIYAEAGEIFAGTKEAPVSATTVFKSVGIAIEDIATAKLVYDAASSGVTL